MVKFRKGNVFEVYICEHERQASFPALGFIGMLSSSRPSKAHLAMHRCRWCILRGTKRCQVRHIKFKITENEIVKAFWTDRLDEETDG